MTLIDTNEGERTHYLFSPSGSKRWLNCRGSLVLQPGATERGSSAAADEGTAAHAVAQDGLETDRSGFDYIIAGTKVRVADNIWPVTDDMADAVDIYLNYIRENWPKSDFEWHIEERVDMPTIHSECSGTPDFWAYSPSRMKLVVIDYKHGAGIPVEVFEHGEPNTQALIYAIGIVRNLQRMGFHVTHIDLVIVQPRAFHKDGPIRRVGIMEGHLERYESEFAAVAKGPETLCPGTWCKWCNNEHCCKALGKEMEALLELPATTMPEALSPERIAELLDKQAMMKSWFAALTSYAKDLVLLGHTVPGWGISETLSNRTWVDGAEKELHAAYGDVIYEPRALKSPAQLEKIKGAKAFLKNNELTTRTPGYSELKRT